MSFQQILTEFRSSFRYKLFFVFTSLTALLSILLGTLYVTNEIHEDRANAKEQLQLLTQQLALSIRLPLYAENRETLQHVAKQAIGAPLVHSVSIMTADGKLLAEVHRSSAKFRTETIAATEDVFSDPLASSVEEALTGAPPGGTGQDRKRAHGKGHHRAFAQNNQTGPIGTLFCPSFLAGGVIHLLPGAPAGNRLFRGPAEGHPGDAEWGLQFQDRSALR